ncbi:MAG: hypothetical protein VX938_04440, partial [Myxococcota bacterium]|nr:hypothetical protein [Myxococcota bacterium]MEE2779092.1 hypothetical protein [Myxococcota bacterium]
ALQMFDHEPTVLEVQDAAARYARVNTSAYDWWRAKTAWANTMPKKVSGEYWYLNRKETDVRTTTTSTSDTVARDDHERFRFVAEWDLSRLIFNPDALTATRETSRLVERREDLLTTVNKLYFARRQLQAEGILAPPADPRKALKAKLRLDGLTADLDALTGGWFSQQLANSRVAQGEPAGASPRGLNSPTLP